MAKYKIKLIPLHRLRHTERINKPRARWLKKKILKEGVWTRPVYIEENHFLVMDGHHRIAVAIELKFTVIPCVLTCYKNVKVKSMRKNYRVTPELIIEKALKGQVFPFKTTKHQFPEPLAECAIPVKSLIKKGARAKSRK